MKDLWFVLLSLFLSLSSFHYLCLHLARGGERRVVVMPKVFTDILQRVPYTQEWKAPGHGSMSEFGDGFSSQAPDDSNSDRQIQLDILSQ